MALRKRVYTNEETVITAENLNDIQDAVIALEDGLFSVDDNKSGEVIAITDAAKRGFRSLSIFGKTTQDGTPTPDAPVDLVSIGDSGSITVSVTGENNSQSMTIATPGGLPGIPVTSGGNYTDADGQQWICDEIDFARGVYVQRTEKVDMGTLIWENDSINSRFLTNSVNNKVKRGTRATRLMTSIGYDCKYNSEYLAKWDNAIYVAGPTVYIHDSNYTTVESLTDAVSGGMLLYPLENPIETSLSEEELAAYASLYTYRDNTTVSNDAGAYMELEYVMDAKKYIDSLVGGGASARLTNVTLLASAWKTEADGLHYQVVSIAGVTPYSKVDLLPSVEQLAIFHNKDVAFVTENEGGVVTVFAIGDKPTLNYTMQASITEVVV